MMDDCQNKVLVCGSRGFNDYLFLEQTLNNLLYNLEGVCIISGGARGADSLAERYAKEKSLGLQVFPANWEQYGKSAGYRRNLQMLEVATHVVAFWDGSSRGTKHTIDNAKSLELRVILTSPN